MGFGPMEGPKPWKGLGAPLQLGLDQVPRTQIDTAVWTQIDQNQAARWEERLGRLCVRQRCRLGEGEEQKVLVRGQQGTGLGLSGQKRLKKGLFAAYTSLEG